MTKYDRRWESSLGVVAPLFLLLLVLMSPAALGVSFDAVPGEVLSYQPSPSLWDLLFNNEIYISSPSIVMLPNGYYVASHDLFGGGSNADVSGTTKVFLSTNKGATWTAQTTLTDMNRGSLFVLDNVLYMFGYTKESGNIVVRKSTNNGATWTTPTNSTNGLIKTGSYGSSSFSPVIYNGRLWTTPSTRVMSAAVGSDLLNASSWTLSNSITQDSSWLNGTFTYWSESQIVASPQTGVVIMPKVDGLPYSALLKATAPGTLTFNATTDFVSVPGAEKKFGARYDAASGKFYILDNPVLPAHVGYTTATLTRNTAAVLSSKDLYHWDVEQIFLYSPNIAYEAFQYFNFDFDNNDMIIASRTAFDVDAAYLPPRGHDSNLLTFHKIENFRTISPNQILIADTANNQVLRYEQTQNPAGNAPLGKFTLGATFGGAALSHPDRVAQAANGDVYIREQGGRILRFDALGNFISVVTSSPVPLQSTQISVQQPAYGERSWIKSSSGQWNDPINWYYWGRPDTNYEVATFGSAASAASTITLDESYKMKGLRFRSANKYTLAGVGDITIESNVGNGVIDVQQGGHDVQLATKLNSHTDAHAENGASLRFLKKLDLNGKKLFVSGQGKLYANEQFVMHGGTLVLDGLAAFTFGSGSIATLDGDLQFLPASSLSLTPGQSFDLLDGAAYLGSETFNSLLLPTLSQSAWSWDTSRLYTDGIVTVVPEPGTVSMLLMLGAAFLLGRWLLHRSHGRR